MALKKRSKECDMLACGEQQERRVAACKQLWEFTLTYLKYSGVGAGAAFHNDKRSDGYSGLLDTGNTRVAPIGCFDLGGPSPAVKPYALRDIKTKLFELVAELPEA